MHLCALHTVGVEKSIRTVSPLGAYHIELILPFLLPLPSISSPTPLLMGCPRPPGPSTLHPGSFPIVSPTHTVYPAFLSSASTCLCVSSEGLSLLCTEQQVHPHQSHVRHHTWGSEQDSHARSVGLGPPRYHVPNELLPLVSGAR